MSFQGWIRMPMTPVMQPPMRKSIRSRPQVGEVVGRADDVGRDVGRQRGEARARPCATDSTTGCWNLVEQLDRVPDRLAVDDDGGRGHGHADEGVEPHRQRQAQRLAQDLVALRTGRSG